jgi:biopolymer transport protein ExbD
MMRKRVKISRRTPVEDPEIIVIPMIDVMMFLLFFFMVASLAMVVQSGLPVNLPKASQGSEHSSQNITITVQQGNRMFLNLKPVTLAQITTGLQALHVAPESLVIINADEAVSHGLVVGVMNEASKAGITRFTFATNKS